MSCLSDLEFKFESPSILGIRGYVFSTMPHYLALGHQARVGKDTFAALWGESRKMHIVRIAGPVYEIAEHALHTLGKPVAKNPALLQTIGESFRGALGEDVWIDAAVLRIRELQALYPDDDIVIVDMRYQNEMKVLQELGFKTVKIERADRPIDRDPNHKSEIDLRDAAFDFVIDNNGDMQEFIARVRTLQTEL